MESAASFDNSGMRRVELIAVGREILRGRVLDTNSNWLAKALTGMGGFERVMAVVPGSYLKADPKGFGAEVRLAVYITAEAASEEAAHAIVHQARDQFRDVLEALGYGLEAAE